jgi:Rieske Fe-S protein
VLLTGLATAATAALASCSSSGSSPSASSSAPSSASSSDGSSNGSSGGSGGSGAGSIIAVSAVPVGGSASATSSEGKPIIVSQPKHGDIVAFTAICTHMGCTVAPAGAQLKCPCHGSVYDAFTGKNISGPAPSPLAPVQVKVAGGKVVAG